MKCTRCRGSGFVMSYDPGISGAEEYKDCLKCSGTGINYIPFHNSSPTIVSETPCVQIKKPLNKRRRIIL